MCTAAWLRLACMMADLFHTTQTGIGWAGLQQLVSNRKLLYVRCPHSEQDDTSSAKPKILDRLHTDPRASISQLFPAAKQHGYFLSLGACGGSKQSTSQLLKQKHESVYELARYVNRVQKE